MPKAVSLVKERSPNLASQMRVAFASMVSNTGSSSPGELEMTLQHLRGRGLLLQRFAQLVEQPGVLDGDDRLVGESGDQLDLLVGEGRPPCGEGDHADRVPSLSSGTHQNRATPAPRADALSG